MSNELVPMGMNEMLQLAKAVAQSKLFGVKTPEEALSLMAIAQAEGLHPAIAARDYHIIKGRPTLKADAMLSRFQAAGGKVEWHSYTDECCDATLSHAQGGTVRVMWDMARVKKAEISNSDMYKKYPRNMLRARVISEGIRTIYPGVAVGIYTPEEQDAFDPPKSAMAQWAETPPSMPETIDQPVIEAPKEKTLVERIKAFSEHLDKMQSLHAVTNIVAANNKLLFEVKEKLPQDYEKLCVKINQINEAFQLAESPHQEAAE